MTFLHLDPKLSVSEQTANIALDKFSLKIQPINGSKQRKTNFRHEIFPKFHRFFEAGGCKNRGIFKILKPNL
jgi:hypothetical protein